MNLHFKLLGNNGGDTVTGRGDLFMALLLQLIESMIGDSYINYKNHIKYHTENFQQENTGDQFFELL